jgi:hypothetical protein
MICQIARPRFQRSPQQTQRTYQPCTCIRPSIQHTDLSNVYLSEDRTTETVFERLKRWWELIPVDEDTPITITEALRDVWGLTKGVRVWVAWGSVFLVRTLPLFTSVAPVTSLEA